MKNNNNGLRNYNPYMSKINNFGKILQTKRHGQVVCVLKENDDDLNPEIRIFFKKDKRLFPISIRDDNNEWDELIKEFNDLDELKLDEILDRVLLKNISISEKLTPGIDEFDMELLEILSTLKYNTKRNLDQIEKIYQKIVCNNMDLKYNKWYSINHHSKLFNNQICVLLREDSDKMFISFGKWDNFHKNFICLEYGSDEGLPIFDVIEFLIISTPNKQKKENIWEQHQLKMLMK